MLPASRPSARNDVFMSMGMTMEEYLDTLDMEGPEILKRLPEVPHA